MVTMPIRDRSAGMLRSRPKHPSVGQVRRVSSAVYGCTSSGRIRLLFISLRLFSESSRKEADHG
jgi:hypothetical protein